MEPVTIEHYKVLSPGTYSPRPKEIVVTAEDVQDYVDAVNIKQKLGVPVAIKYMHLDGVKSIAVGKQINAVMEGDDAYADLILSMNAEFDGEIIATIEQMVSGLQDQILQGSMEAYPGYNSPAYTGERVFGLWPTAWAVLPAGEQPAVPPKLIAGESEISLICISGAPIRGDGLIERGQDMTLEEALKEIATLKAEIAELKKAATKEDAEASEAVATENTDLKSKLKVFEAAEATALKTKAEELEKSVLEKTLAGNREDLKTQIDTIEDSHQRVQFLEIMDKSLTKPEVKKEKLNAGEVVEDDTEDPYLKKVNAAEKLAKEKNIPFVQALEQIVG